MSAVHAQPEPTDGASPSLDLDLREQRALFDAAMAARDVDAAVAAVLSVDDAMVAWAADTLQSDVLDRLGAS